MEIKIRKLGRHKWEMYLVPSNPTDTMDDVLNYYNHDHRVSLIDDELRESAATMYSKQAWDRWHWYDKPELDKFLTIFLLKHGEK